MSGVQRNAPLTLGKEAGVTCYCGLYVVGKSWNLILGIKEQFTQGNGMMWFIF